MNHLIHDCSRKRIAIISNRLSHTSYLMRYQAYIDALRQEGLSPYEAEDFKNEDLYEGHELTSDTLCRQYGIETIPRFGTPIITRGTQIEQGYEAASRIIASGNLPDAIFVTADSLAVGVIQALQKAGIRVPQDIAIAGYDHVDVSDAVTPALTTIHVDRELIGRTAIRKLVELIKDPQKPSETVYIPNKLIIRGSTTEL